MKPLLLLLLILLPGLSGATVWQVGPSRTYQYCSQVAPLVQDGDTVEIDAALYVNDPQVQWSDDNLYIVGVGGRPRLEAGSNIAGNVTNGKGIFVISGDQVKVENIEFALATVPDHNGAGIRQEGANLTVLHCRFVGNEMGILAGNIPNCKTVIEHCEFLNGGSVLNPGYQHNVYINHIDTLIFRFNYSHDAIAEGHELKSRADVNVIMYNRIANETTSDSRTIDLPNGGICILVGNIIEQGVNSANSNLLGYGLEGLTNPAPHNLWVSGNTFINKKATGSFIHVANGTDTLFLRNNIMAGAATGGYIIGTPAVLDSSFNLRNTVIASFGFADLSGYDYHLTAGSPAVNAGSATLMSVSGYPLDPDLMYRDTCDYENRNITGPVDIGAFELQPAVGLNEPPPSRAEVYPNPCTNLILIEGGAGEEFEIRNWSGQILLTATTGYTDVSILPPGMYLIRSKNKSGIFTKL